MNKNIDLGEFAESIDMLVNMHKDGWRIEYNFREENSLKNFVKIKASNQGHYWTTGLNLPLREHD